MVATSVEIQEEKSTIPVRRPLLSVVVPVYNGSNKIGSTLRKIKAQLEKLEPAVRKLETQGEGRENSPVYTGRKLIDNAGAAMLLDEYLSKHPEALSSKFERGNNSRDVSLEPPYYEIIVVNDGSKDDTRNVVQQISLTDETIRLMSYSINMGKGYAIKQGVLHSLGKYVLFLDGDGDISTEVLSRFLEQMASADIVIGSKYHPFSAVRVPNSRKFFSKCFHLFVKLTLGIKVSDTQVGLKGGRGDNFRKIFQRIIVKRYAFDAEMLAVAGILGLNVVELPVKIDLDKSFKKKEIAKMAADVLGVTFRLRVIKWYQKTMQKQRPYYRALMFS
jgi:glycosyltransferase involved in cell wall biosynthesis